MSNTATRTTGGQALPNTRDDVQYMPTQTPSQPYQQNATPTNQYDPQQSGKLAPLATTTPTASWMPQLRLIAKLISIGILVWAFVTAAITTYNWSVDRYNTYNYGPTRVYATTAVLGLDGDNEGNPSDVAIANFRGNLELLINPAGDTTKTQTYPAGQLISDSASKTPAYVTFARNSKSHKLDIVIHIVGQSQLLTFTSTGTDYTLVKQ